MAVDVRVSAVACLRLAAVVVALTGCDAGSDTVGPTQSVAAQPTQSVAVRPTQFDAMRPPQSVSAEVRRGCLAFTDELDRKDSNEVYDDRTKELRVAIGPQVYVLSESAAECRGNPVAMDRLRRARLVEEENQAG